ncbi:helix-turn-helix transcriptional regulator [Paenibacillus sp. SN-8-1]|uniref:helix-turn-helix transcriptional regulator n=1 Tax=Paenibacillus sp. SN-8-1 TaxID=3435409 RepID=UPI003D9A7C99
MRADRLLNIVMLLQNNGKMTSAKLAAELEVNARTIVRDMESLSAAGIPVYSERGPQGGWCLSEGYRTNLTGLKSREVLALMLSASPALFKELGIEEDHKSASRKLFAATSEQLRHDADLARQRLHIDGAGWYPSKESVPLLPTIQEAVWAGHKLSIKYMKATGMEQRLLCPLGLIVKGTIWYLAASEGSTENKVHTYRVSRINKVAAVHDTFSYPESFNLAEYWEQSTREFRSNLPRYPASLRIEEEVYSRFTRERFVKVLGSESSPDDAIHAEVEFNTLESALSIILSYGRSIWVLAPAELRDAVIQEASTILAAYTHSHSSQE